MAAFATPYNARVRWCHLPLVIIIAGLDWGCGALNVRGATYGHFGQTSARATPILASAALQDAANKGSAIESTTESRSHFYSEVNRIG